MCHISKTRPSEGLTWPTYLTRADLVEGNKGEGLRQHGRRKVFLGPHERNQQRREQQLRQEGERLDARQTQPALGGRRRLVQLRVVGAEVVAVVEAGDVMEERVADKVMAVQVEHGGVEPHEGRKAQYRESQPRGRQEAPDGQAGFLGT